jgi:hypothetical protein
MTTSTGGRRQWRALLPLGALVLVVACGVQVVAPAADHRDGPIFVNTQANGFMDINDIYIFTSPATPANTVMAMTVSPFTGSVTPVTFDKGQYYDLKIDQDGDAIEDLTFRVSFDTPDANGVQNVVLRGLPAAKFPPTGILATGKTGQNLPVRGGGMFRAANHDDPFFFDSVGFNMLLNKQPYPRPVGTAKNLFGPNVNTLAIILEVPTTRLLKGGNTNIGMWGRIERNGVQVDRMGRPAINTALIPPVPRGSNITNPKPDRRNAFNAGIPSNDQRDFHADMMGVLTDPNGIYKRSQADATGLTNFLLPDILTVDTSNATVFPNGRGLRDPVIHVELGLLTNGAITTDNVNDDNGSRITDGTNGTTAAFPYFGPPNNPPQGIILQ